MKKFLTIFSMFFLVQNLFCTASFESIALAGENPEISPIQLKKGENYILNLEENVLFIKSSDPTVLKARKITNIFNEDDEIILTARDYGDANLSIITKNNSYNYYIIVKDEEKDLGDAIFLIDRPPEGASRLQDTSRTEDISFALAPAEPASRLQDTSRAEDISFALAPTEQESNNVGY